MSANFFQRWDLVFKENGIYDILGILLLAFVIWQVFKAISPATAKIISRHAREISPPFFVIVTALVWIFLSGYFAGLVLWVMLGLKFNQWYRNRSQAD